jgi:uncharacterized membrane protein YebE (DUF533 family)
MDLGRVVGALLGGAARRPVRRSRTRRAANPLTQLGLGGRSRQAVLGRALVALADVAVEALAKRGQAAPAPTPAPPPRAAPKAARRLPDIGGAGTSPWAARPEPEPEPAAAAAPAAESAEALLLVRAMVAAAQSNGVLDAAERQAIAGQLDGAGLSAEERDFVLADLEHPLSPEALAAEVSDPMQAAQLYAAAVAITGAPEPAERAWLDRLRTALRLDPAAAAAIEKKLGGA